LRAVAKSLEREGRQASGAKVPIGLSKRPRGERGDAALVLAPGAGACGITSTATILRDLRPVAGADIGSMIST